MAYGKIKCDSVIYDNSGSDVEKTVVSLTTPEGTAVKSTGESGTTKFLRVDGDGTCSWQVPTDTNTQLSAEQVQDFVGAMVTGNTETGIAVTYEDGDGTLDFVVGTLNQDTTGTAAEATNVTAVANNSTDETVYPTFVDGATGTQGIETDTGLTYNPSTGLLTAVGLTLSGDLTVNGTTTTINSTTLSVDDKNIELGSVSSPSDTTADGGGITLKGATDKTFNWVDATNAWTSSEHIVTAAGKIVLIGTTTEGHANADELTVASTGNTGITVRSGTSNNGSIFFADGTSGNGAFEGQIEYLHTDNSLKLHTNHALALLINSSQNATFSGTVSDLKGDVRSIPQNHKTSAYVLVASDAGKCIKITTGGITVNNNVFSTGDAVTIINHSGSDQTITQGSGFTLHNAADAATGNRTLAGRGMATIWFENNDQGYISGAGLS